MLVYTEKRIGGEKVACHKSDAPSVRPLNVPKNSHWSDSPLLTLTLTLNLTLTLTLTLILTLNLTLILTPNLTLILTLTLARTLTLTQH